MAKLGSTTSNVKTQPGEAEAIGVGVNIPRVFIGGFEITRFIRSVEVSISRDDVATVSLDVVAWPVNFDDDCIFIGELPNDEFMAEMVRIKLMREGVMDTKKGE